VSLQKDGFAFVSVDRDFTARTRWRGPPPENAPGRSRKKEGEKSQGLVLKQDDYLAMVEADMVAVKLIHLRRTPGGQPEHDQDGDRRTGNGASIAVAFAVKDWDELPYDDGHPASRRREGKTFGHRAHFSRRKISWHSSCPNSFPRIKGPRTANRHLDLFGK